MDPKRVSMITNFVEQIPKATNPALETKMWLTAQMNMYNDAQVHFTPNRNYKMKTDKPKLKNKSTID